MTGLLATVALLLAPGVAHGAGGSIAFLRDGNIWLAAPDGANARQLTTAGDYLFVSAAKGSGSPLLGFRQGDSYGVINALTGAQQTVATASQPQSDFYDAELNAAGTQLAYVWSFQVGQFTYENYRIANVDGAALTEDGGFGVQDTAFADPSGATVVWSGLVHGAYGSHQPDSCGNSQIGLGVETPLAGGGTDYSQPLAIICPAGLDTTQPEVSPNGSEIAATVQPTGGGATMVDVFPKQNAATGTQLTPNGSSAAEPDWSPDGSGIAFEGANDTIWTIPAAGGTPTMILSNAERPAWTPAVISSPPPPEKLALSLKASAAQKVVAHKGVAATVECNVACSVAASGAISIKGSHRKLALRPVTATLAASRPETVTLRLSSGELGQIKKALRRHERITASIGAGAKDSAGVQAKTAAGFTVRH